MSTKPTKKHEKSNGFMPSGIPIDIADPQLDPFAVEQLIENRGIRFLHYRMVPCPNVRSIDENVHDPNCDKCENGFLFYGGDYIDGAFSSNNLRQMYEAIGTWLVGEAVVTFTAYTRNENGAFGKGKAVDMQNGDKLICLDYTVRHYELVQHSPTGIDRLKYPAKEIEFLATEDVQYHEGTDFVVDESGRVKWTSQNQPRYDQLTGTGETFAIAYHTNPVFFVTQVLHEIRATKAYNRDTGQIEAVRLPQSVLITRDFIFESGIHDSKGEKHARFPASGGTIVPG